MVKGEPGAGKKVVHNVTWGNSLSQEVLGMDYIPFDQCVRDTVDAVRKRGW